MLPLLTTGTKIENKRRLSRKGDGGLYWTLVFILSIHYFGFEESYDECRWIRSR